MVEFFSRLKPHLVADPFAEHVVQKYPTKNIQARRDFSKLLNLVDVVAWLYQYQRVKAKKGLTLAVVASIDDWIAVLDLASPSLKESLTGVSPQEERILKIFSEAREVETDSFGNNITTSYSYLTVSDVYTKIRRQVRRGEQWCRDHIKRLVEEEYLEEHPENDKGRQGLKYRFSELQPETMNFKPEDYNCSDMLEEWVRTHGWEPINSQEFPASGGDRTEHENTSR